jgi:hypothetical protein
MKTKLSLLAAIFSLLLSSWITPATSEKPFSVLSKKIDKKFNPDFAFFRTHRQGHGIMATWGLTTNQGVSGFVVQKTYEDPNDPYSNWEVICAVPCVPGRSFKHHDLNVFPGFISYRVIAYFLMGGSMMSSISTVHIVGH